VDAGRRVKRAAVRIRNVAVALATAACAPVLACPVEIVGTWRLTAATEPQPMLVTFATDGWANVETVTGAGRPEDFDTIAQVRYQLVPRRNPKRIEFQTARGNDLFPAGTSSWEIINSTDESFSSRRSDSTAGETAQWSRIQTHRYFLTFAARDGAGGREQATFVMWTTLDGQKPKYEALGAAKLGAEARFGRMPDEALQSFVRESKRTDETMLRIELNEAEYFRTHQVFEAWNALLSRDVLAKDDPDRQVLGLLDAALQSVNRCGLKIRTTPDGVAAAPARNANELVRTIRRINDRRHVPDKVFPFRWQRPAVES
jgi:hypothetical protein